MWYVLTEIVVLLLLAILLGLMTGWLLWRRGRVSMSRADHDAMVKRCDGYRSERDHAIADLDGFEKDLQSARHDRDDARELIEDRDRQISLREQELRRLRSPEPTRSHRSAVAAAVPAGAGWALPADNTGHDELQQITGIGPDMEALLNRNGIRTHRQLANLNRADVELLQTQLEDFPDRIRTDNWIGQARDLSIKAGEINENDRRRWWSF